MSINLTFLHNISSPFPTTSSPFLFSPPYPPSPTSPSASPSSSPSSPHVPPSVPCPVPVPVPVPSSPPQSELSNTARMASATFGALLTSLVVTPFDVVKTRLQAQIHLSSHLKGQTVSVWDTCTHIPLQTGITDTWCHRCDIPGAPPPSHSASHSASSLHSPSPSPSSPSPSSQLKFNNSLDAFLKILRYEGVGSLWRGLSPTLIHSIPATVIYFWGYDNLKIFFDNHQLFLSHSDKNNNNNNNRHNDLSPLFAGVTARAIATIVVSPIELIKTKTQSLSRTVSPYDILVSELEKGGVRSLWRGAGPTLWRDIPFSAVYWTIYEYIKSTSFSYYSQRNRSKGTGTNGQLNHSLLLWTSFLAGAGSGMIAAITTHPFDIVKTRRQIEVYALNQPSPSTASASHSPPPSPPSTTLSVFRSIIATEGYMGLTSGLAARIGKIVPACAIMISTYELAKAKFGSTSSKINKKE